MGNLNNLQGRESNPFIERLCTPSSMGNYATPSYKRYTKDNIDSNFYIEVTKGPIILNAVLTGAGSQAKEVYIGTFSTGSGINIGMLFKQLEGYDGIVLIARPDANATHPVITTYSKQSIEGHFTRKNGSSESLYQQCVKAEVERQAEHIIQQLYFCYQDSNLQRLAYLIYYVGKENIRRYMNTSNDHCGLPVLSLNKSSDHLASIWNISRRSVSRYLSDLAGDGILIHNDNVFRINIDMGKMIEMAKECGMDKTIPWFNPSQR